MEKLLTARQASETVGVPVGSLYRLVRAKIVPSYRAGVRGRGVRFRASELIDALRRESTKPITGAGETA